MNSRTLISYILLSTLVLLLLFTVVQADKYTEKAEQISDKDALSDSDRGYFSCWGLLPTDKYKKVKAEDVLKQIENGQDVNLTDCRIVGELNLNKIKLKNIPNPKYQEISQHSGEQPSIINFESGDVFDYLHPEIRGKLKVVESNITIQNCILEDDLDFSYALFKKPLSFAEVTCSSNAFFTGSYFNNSTHFGEVTYDDSGDSYFVRKMIFNHTADFSYTNFEDNTDFSFATFNYTANFYGAVFNDTSNFFAATSNCTDFSNGIFNDNANFSCANFQQFSLENTTFKSNANFKSVTFGDDELFRNVSFKDANFRHSWFESSVDFINASYKYADFRDAVFEDSACFDFTTFDTANFCYATFNDTCEFEGPEIGENIIMDGRNSQMFIKYYKEKGQLRDADIIYYNYRKWSQAQKQWNELSKWTDLIDWFTCGYGVRPSNTLYLGGTLIVLFSVIYAKGPAISLDNTSNKKISLRFDLQGPGIMKRKKDSEYLTQKVSFRDALYFSVNTFTTVGDTNWYPKENFKKWVTLEGLLGWVLLGIFMATLSTVMIRV